MLVRIIAPDQAAAAVKHGLSCVGLDAAPTMTRFHLPVQGFAPYATMAIIARGATGNAGAGVTDSGHTPAPGHVPGSAPVNARSARSGVSGGRAHLADDALPRLTSVLAAILKNDTRFFSEQLAHPNLNNGSVRTTPHHDGTPAAGAARITGGAQRSGH